MGSTATNPALLVELRILLVDDSRFNQRFAQMILQKHGSLVTVAGDGEEALAVEVKCCFDLILMDVEMPILDGFQATAVIRTRERSTERHIPIIAMSAHSSAEYRERCLAAGMDGYVEKPIDPAELEKEVRATWEKAKGVQE